jgi:hypothetical protein
MAKAKTDNKSGTGTIAQNKRARHEYHIDEHYEAGIALEGWEVKSLRAGRINLGDAYAIVKSGEIFLFGASIVPLISASTHVIADDRRTRKLLLNRAEIDSLFNLTDAEFRVEGPLVAIGPLPSDDMIGLMTGCFESKGLVYYDEFFELSGNWPEWLRLYAM